MGRERSWVCLAMLAACGLGGTGAALATSTEVAIVDFETEPAGTSFGAGTHHPGEPAFSQNGIDMSVESFFLGGFEGFFRAEILAPSERGFPTAALGVDNISVRFDFDAVGFDVRVVTLEFMEFGGSDNFSVNDYSTYQLDELVSLPADVDVAPGVSASVDSGVITLIAHAGSIDNFLIGGQELLIDNVVAVPEPAVVVLLVVGAAFVGRRGARFTSH